MTKKLFLLTEHKWDGEGASPFRTDNYLGFGAYAPNHGSEILFDFIQRTSRQLMQDKGRLITSRAVEDTRTCDGIVQAATSELGGIIAGLFNQDVPANQYHAWGLFEADAREDLLRTYFRDRTEI